MDNFLYEGKAKRVFLTDKKDEVIIFYKDDATAFNGVKKASISNKGILNNKITELEEVLHDKEHEYLDLLEMSEREEV